MNKLSALQDIRGEPFMQIRELNVSGPSFMFAKLKSAVLSPSRGSTVGYLSPRLRLFHNRVVTPSGKP